MVAVIRAMVATITAVVTTADGEEKKSKWRNTKYGYFGFLSSKFIATVNLVYHYCGFVR
jgi:hypothetical protein